MKELEEMINVISECLVKAKDTLGSMNADMSEWIAERLYKDGYRKVTGGEGYKPYSDSTLAQQTKEWLISDIHCLEYNWQNAEEDNKRQVESFKRFLEIERTEAKNEALKELLQELKKTLKGSYTTLIDYGISNVECIAKKYGIELDKE